MEDHSAASVNVFGGKDDVTFIHLKHVSLVELMTIESRMLNRDNQIIKFQKMFRVTQIYFYENVYEYTK